MPTDTRKTIDDIIAMKEVASACKALGPILSAVKAGQEVADTIMVSAQETWRTLRDEGSPLSRNEFTVLQGRLLVPTVTRENRYSESMGKMLVAVIVHNFGFMWAVVQDTQEALIALPKWEVRSVTPWDSRRLVEVYDKVTAKNAGPEPETGGDVVDILADSRAAVVVATGQRLAALRRFAGLVKRQTKDGGEDDGGGEMNQLADQIEVKKTELMAANEKIADLLKAGADVDVTSLGAALAEKKKTEAEITQLEAELAKAESGKVVPPTPDANKALDEVDDAGGGEGEEDEFELFAEEVRASALTTDQQGDVLATGLTDLAGAKAEFALAVEARNFKPEPEPELTPEEQFQTQVKESTLGTATKAALIQLATRGLDAAKETFMKAVTKKAKTKK